MDGGSDLDKRKLAAYLTAAVCLVCLAFTSGVFYGRRTAGDGYLVRTERQVETTAALPAAESGEKQVSESVNSTLVSTAQTAQTADRLDLNTATAEQLQTLPGIGEVLSGRIVAYREQYGRFASVADLLNVEGIGEATYMAVRDLVYVLS